MAESRFLTDATTIQAICAELRAAAEAHPMQPHNTLLPTPEQLDAMVSTLFWTSLRQEEGQTVTPHIVFAEPATCGFPLVFREARPFAEDVLAKLAPAFASPRTAIGVHLREESLALWGATWEHPPFSARLRVAAPGVVVVRGCSNDFYFRGRSVFEVRARLEPLIRPLGLGRREQNEQFVTI